MLQPRRATRRRLGRVAISGSARDAAAMRSWKQRWEAAGYEVVDYPRPIPVTSLAADYPEVYRYFHDVVRSVDILFVANLDRGGVVGYIGAATFADMSFVNARNVLEEQRTRILLLQAPGEAVASRSEVGLWLAQGWIERVDEGEFGLAIGEPA